MKLENQCCTLIQAKRLKELGVKQESVFYHIPPLTSRNDSCIVLKPYPNEDDYSAFTVAELGEMLPKKIINERYYLKFSFTHNDQPDNICVCVYEDSELGHKPIPIEEVVKMKFYQTLGNTEAKARAAMLIYLLENNLIKP